MAKLVNLWPSVQRAPSTSLGMSLATTQKECYDRFIKVLVLKNLERGFYVVFFPVLFWLVLGTESYVSAGEHHTNLWGSCGSAGVLFQCYQKVIEN